ncbi:hypothetical protein [Maribacter sp. 1_MG-2023]|uniref:hypothetical protein n=1 Tax=Maribacter sp. 1_MG-2023 TaxID=3062677 RepID=UPI0026E229B7|nr:hypothetical protein [Maribacter sp. 1_MG-2023]MDO6472753.1 hypothetical protein [Maribacter sp. 1_MG-2023]
MDNQKIKYKIIVSPDISEELSAQIFRYWAFDISDFNYSLEDLTLTDEESEFPFIEVQTNSCVKMTLTHCKLCFNSILVTAYNRKEFMQYLQGYYDTCDVCKLYSPNYDETITLSKPLKTRLKQLNKNELRVLKGIVKLKSKALIYQHIFNNNVMDTNIWKIINSLQRKDLIWVERDDEGRIKFFHFKSELIDNLDS